MEPFNIITGNMTDDWRGDNNRWNQATQDMYNAWINLFGGPNGQALNPAAPGGDIPAGDYNPGVY